MSRPFRYGLKPLPQANPYDKNGPNGTDAAAAVGLNKARAQFNEPIVQLQAIFPDWKEEDLISVLEEVRGDVELAVARISDGHAEQWGAVKHKKEKKQTSPREREHSSPRGASSSRGRGGRGGGRGAGPHSGPFRQQHRDRTTNDSSPTPAAAVWPAASTTTTTDSPRPASNALKEKDSKQEATDAPSTETGDELWAATPSSTLPDDSSAPAEQKPEEPSESPTTAPAASAKSSHASASTSSAKSRSKPGVSGRSWAQIAKPVSKPLPAPVQQPAPLAEPPTTTTQETVPDAPEPAREEPTTVEAPTWDDEPAPAQPPASQPAAEQSADGWVDANPTSSKSETDSWTDVGPQQKSESTSWKQPAEQPPTATQPSEPVAQQQQETPGLPQIRQPTPDAFSPPPGLANPALTSPTPPKPTTPSNSRPTFGVHRPSSRFKTDQAVIMPSQSPSNAAGFTIAKTLPLQFGSLDLSGDDSEPHPAQSENTTSAQQPTVEQKQSYGNGPSPSLPAAGPDTVPISQSSQSPAGAYRVQGQQQQQQHQPPPQQQQAPPQQQQQQQHEEPQVPSNASTLGGPVHTQAPSINPALAMAPGPGPAFAQHQHHSAGASHHTLAGLTHTPQHSLPQGLGHSHHPSFGQQGSFPPQQQQYEGAAGTVGGTPFSSLGQSPQGQSQAFFRQTDSPFYNQSHTPVGEHGFGGSSAGGFGQGMQTGFNGAPSLANDFGYDGQRNPYDNYSSQNTFAGRGALRQDDAKGLGGSPGQGLSHHGNAQPSPLSGQPSGGQGQGQYPGMGHMGNTFYYNMNPYGYPNSFYPPAFTSFVNPMYQAGAQTPPHGAKPGNMTASSGIGAPGNSAYSANSSGHLQHASGGFDSDSGPNGNSTYHHPGSALPGDFQKGAYTGAQGFLGGMGASGGVGANRGPGNVTGIASGGVGSTNSPETAFKTYGASAGSALGPAEKSLPTQAGRGVPGVNQGHQQFYQNNRYSNVPQTQGGYPQQQQQGDSYYSNYQQQQRW